MTDKRKLMNGQEIVKLYTSGSIYDNQCINAKDDKGNIFKISVDELIKLFDADVKLIPKKARVHTYL